MNKLKNYILTKNNFVSKTLLSLYLSLLSDNDKKNIILLKNDIKLTCYIKDELMRVDTYIKISENNNGICDDLYNLLLNVTGDNVKLMFLDKLIDDELRFEIIKSIKDENVRLESLNYINDNLYRYKIVSEFKNFSNIKNALDLMAPLYKALVLALVDDDDYKISKLNEFIDVYQIIVIASLNNDSFKKECVFNPKYFKFIEDIIVSINDHNFIINYFKKIDDINLKYRIIAKVNDENLKNTLISLTDEIIYKNIKETNNIAYFEKALSSVIIPYINYNIDTNITFGVELETSCLSYYGVISNKKMFKNWNIVREVLIPHGVEFVSPIYRYDKESLKELCCVCNFLQDNQFFVNELCGGHIHFGFGYFKSKSHFRTFLNLYSSVEDILYIISNRQGLTPRDLIKKQAKPIRELVSNSEEYVNRWKFSTLKQYSNLVKSLEVDRYYSLNLKNIYSINKNTIEYRIPNGEIDFNELNANIRLIAKMMEKSKEISESLYGYGNNKEIVNDYKYLLEERDILNRFDVFLDLLFDNSIDKEIYVNRFNVNRKLVNVRSLMKKRI